MTRHQSPEFNALLREIESRESCRINVSTGDMAGRAYKIYVDGNVRVTPHRFKHLQASGTEVIPVVPGEHRVVVREAEVLKNDRVESNTIVFSLREHQEIKLVVQVEGAALSLSRRSGS